jgi:hypothetical protein
LRSVCILRQWLAATAAQPYTPGAASRGSAVNERKDMTVKRMDNVLIVVDDLEAARAFFIELGLKLEGETTVEWPLVGSLIGLKDVGPPGDDADCRWAGH